MTTTPRQTITVPVPRRATVIYTLGGAGALLFLGGAGGLDQLAFTAPSARAALLALLTGLLLLAAAYALYVTAPGRRA